MKYGCGAAAIAAVGIVSVACVPDRIDGTASDKTEPTEMVVRPDAIRAHIEFLADDVLAGREAGTEGYDIAARYVASQFRALGLKPAGENDTYFQNVPLRASYRVAESVELIVRDSQGSHSLSHPEDFIIGANPRHETGTIRSDAVFVGYGIVAPEFGHDDYAELDVEGKVVVIMTGFPKSFPSEEGAHYSSTRSKARVADEHGALGTITIYSPGFEVVRPYGRVTLNLHRSSMTWIGEDGEAFSESPDLQVEALMSPAGGAVLFEGAERSYEQVRADAAADDREPKGFPLAVRITLSQATRHETLESANVAAVLEGSDPLLKDQYVVFTAHLDAHGTGTEADGDGIYNGAMDNAAGIATMIEAARVFVASGNPPRRSVLFLALTAEEKGLIGAEYFAKHPTVPIDNIVANINLDMPMLLYDFTDVVAFGAQHSTLGETVGSASEKLGVSLSPDPVPQYAVFVRSDHYRFVQQGVPAVMLATGFANGGAEIIMDFQKNHYHMPSDDASLPIDYAAGAKFAMLNYLIGREIADRDERPVWYENDFFGELFGR